MEPTSAALLGSAIVVATILARVIEKLVDKKTKNANGGSDSVALAEQKMRLDYMHETLKEVRGNQEDLVTKIVELTGAQTRLCDKIGDLVDSVKELVRKAA